MTNPSMSMTMGMYRLVVLEDPGGIQKQYVETLDLVEITETLRRDNVLGVFIGKE